MDLENKIDEKYFEKSGLTDLEWIRVLCRWEDLIGLVYAQMWDNFPELMNADLMNILLEREREMPG
jgi:hypothetical protein